MKILIDARLYGLEHAGIGRYVMELLNHLSQIDKVNDYLILNRREQTKKFSSSNFKFQIVDIPHYSLQEQVELPKILNSLDFDLVHFPHFNVPIFFNKPFIVTIHDLIKHTSTGPQTTTRAPFLYWLKYWGYKIVFKNAVNRAQKIVVPSKAIKDELLKTYRLPQKKVVVIYEGVDEVFSKERAKSLELSVLEKYRIKIPYVIYTGSAYPHKNLERLIEAVSLINANVSELNSNELALNLVIVSSRNVFIERLKKFIEKTNSHKFVLLPGFIPDQDLAQLYQNAKAFVFPSLSEGFGLPGLEAMSAGCPVVCSDIPVFHEIYNEGAVYFDPNDVQDMADKIKLILTDDKLSNEVVVKGKKRSGQFSWPKMAKETLEVYKSVL